MSNKYYISDMHFRHKNVLNFEAKHRRFMSIQDHDEWLIKQFNSRVTDRDVTVFGGDMIFGKNMVADLDEIMPRLNGRKELILGNHDELGMDIYMRHFERIGMHQKKTWQKKKVWISHVPIHPSELDYRCSWNLHGHLHSRTIGKVIDVLGEPTTYDDHRYINFCVEHCTGIPRTFDEWMSKTPIPVKVGV